MGSHGSKANRLVAGMAGVSHSPELWPMPIGLPATISKLMGMGISTTLSSASNLYISGQLQVADGHALNLSVRWYFCRGIPAEHRHTLIGAFTSKTVPPMDQNWQGIDMLTDFVGPETTHFWFLCSPYSFVMSFQVWLEASLPFLKFWLLLTWSYIPTCVKIRSLKPSRCPTFGYFATSDMVSPCFSIIFDVLKLHLGELRGGHLSREYFITLHYSIFYHILSYSTLLYYITS